jgi:hypothetical protein
VCQQLAPGHTNLAPHPLGLARGSQYLAIVGTAHHAEHSG